MSERIPWKDYFMNLAKMVAERATCERLKVGAIIVRDKRIIATGYNGSVSGEEHCADKGCRVVDGHCIRTIHSEANAMIQCARYGVPVEGAEIYITHHPCLYCTKLLIQAGIKKVYYSEDYHNDPYAVELLQKAGVEVEQVK